jgi:hypothetical protein
MPTYLLDCRCGNRVPVEIGQAGGQITCKCGTQLDVPPLRQLRHLPVASEEKKGHKTWGARQGVMTLSLLVLAGLIAAIIWSWATQPTIPKFDPEEHLRGIDEHIKSMTPVESWDVWLNYRMMAEHGIPVFEFANRGAIEQQIAHRQSLRRTLGIAAAAMAVIALAAAFWPKPMRRQ